DVPARRDGSFGEPSGVEPDGFDGGAQHQRRPCRPGSRPRAALQAPTHGRALALDRSGHDLGVARQRYTPLSFEVTLILMGAGFGPLPSLTAVALQNVVARHQLGISVGTMNFSRNLFATMLIAVFGAIVLAGAPAGQSLGSAFQAGNPAEAFGRLFLVAAA